MLTERTLQGTHTDAVGPYSLQISDYSIYEFLWHYVTVISYIHFREFPSKLLSMVLHYPCCRTKSHTYRQCQVRNTVKYGSFFAEFIPMPQLTPDSERVVVIGFPPADGMDFKTLYVVRLFQMLMAIRISEDYWLSDIYVADYGNITIRHILNINRSC